jgi:hypothetical protein
MPNETARDATEAMYLCIVNDVELAEAMWDELPGVLRLLTVLAHRELTQRLWQICVDGGSEVPLEDLAEKVGQLLAHRSSPGFTRTPQLCARTVS